MGETLDLFSILLLNQINLSDKALSANCGKDGDTWLDHFGDWNPGRKSVSLCSLFGATGRLPKRRPLE
jgi:hypothetical protein